MIVYFIILDHLLHCHSLSAGKGRLHTRCQHSGQNTADTARVHRELTAHTNTRMSAHREERERVERGGRKMRDKCQIKGRHLMKYLNFVA